MQLETGFRLGMPVEAAWPLLTDLERVAPSMPGVQVDAVEEEGLRATMRVKVGPITATYRTLVSIKSLDAGAHTAVLEASGRETRGPGTVDAVVTAVLSDDAGATAVALTTDLAVTGKVAQFGSGVMAEVADRLLQQFAERLETDLDGTAAPAAPAADRSSKTVAVAPEPAVVDLGRIAADATRPQARAFAAGIVAALLLVFFLRRRH